MTIKNKPESPAENAEPEQPDYLGHRQRLKARYLADLGKSMPDYELLELILTYAIPRKDVKPLAKSLMRRYSCLANVITAPVEDLMSNEGITYNIATLLSLFHACSNKICWEYLENKDVPALSNKKMVVDYCRSCIGYSGQEQLLVIYLNKQGKFITQNIEQVGTIDAVMICPREIAKKVLENKATSIILAHNHPSGNTTPSNADLKMTMQLRDALKPLGVKIEDHIIISPSDFYSMRERAAYVLL